MTAAPSPTPARAPGGDITTPRNAHENRIPFRRGSTRPAALSLRARRGARWRFGGETKHQKGNRQTGTVSAWWHATWGLQPECENPGRGFRDPRLTRCPPGSPCGGDERASTRLRAPPRRAPLRFQRDQARHAASHPGRPRRTSSFPRESPGVLAPALRERSADAMLAGAPLRRRRRLLGEHHVDRRGTRLARTTNAAATLLSTASVSYITSPARLSPSHRD